MVGSANMLLALRGPDEDGGQVAARVSNGVEEEGGQASTSVGSVGEQQELTLGRSLCRLTAG